MRLLIFTAFAIIMMWSCEKEDIQAPPPTNIIESVNTVKQGGVSSSLDEGGAFLSEDHKLFSPFTTLRFGLEDVNGNLITAYAFPIVPDSSVSFNYSVENFRQNYMQSGVNGVEELEVSNLSEHITIVERRDGGLELFVESEMYDQAEYRLRTGNNTVASSISRNSDCDDCWYMDYYVNGTVVYSEFLGCWCFCDDAITCGGTGGGGGNGDEDVDIVDNSNFPDCGVFNYAPSTDDELNVVGVNGVYFNYWDYSTNPNATGWQSPINFHSVEFWVNRTIYFSGPRYEDREYLAENTALAVEAVLERMKEEFGPLGIEHGQAWGNAWVLAALNQEMANFGGEVSFTDPGIGSNPITQFSTSLAFLWDCD